MSLYDRIMGATENPMAVHKVNAAAQMGARLATNNGYPQLAAAAAAGAALFAAVDTVMHAPKVTPGEYATFDESQAPKRGWRR